MKKVLLSIALVVAISAASSVMAQDTKKEACPQKTECTKDAKKCSEADEKKCPKVDEKKSAKADKKKATKKTTSKKCCKK